MNRIHVSLLLGAGLWLSACSAPSVRQSIEQSAARPPKPAAPVSAPQGPVVRPLAKAEVSETPLVGAPPMTPSGPASAPGAPAAPLAPAIERAPVAGLPPQDEQAQPEAQATQLALAAPAPSGGPAVRSLLKQAEEAMRAHDLITAAATLERALRIEPNNAVLWSRLAEVRLMQGDKAQAEQLALKSNGLAAGNPALKARNDQIIARARAR